MKKRGIPHSPSIYTVCSAPETVLAIPNVCFLNLPSPSFLRGNANFHKSIRHRMIGFITQDIQCNGNDHAIFFFFRLSPTLERFFCFLFLFCLRLSLSSALTKTPYTRTRVILFARRVPQSFHLFLSLLSALGRVLHAFTRSFADPRTHAWPTPHH